ncbi:MAG: anti-virulence regulator CigR family protein [Parvibaculum sp.]|uniref:anti-virulence regulator CigR family protein n=1 Tax=Parvibaculum sp. TaxID=2024848 RepID=UPI002717E12A|nr:anti-virulence regulator CigR family protein [Parvibaculum sp.]MDO8837917.1 anti-virulence regulator CigR family protein [Parvibaculum sp.]
MRYTLTAITLTAALVLSSGALLANNHKAQYHKAGKHGGARVSADIGVKPSAIFEADEARLIRDYFSTRPMDVKPLPPGIAKNLARGKPLPPGIAKRYLPGDLTARLPMRTGYERRIVGDDVLLVSVVTGVIVDILNDVF